MPNPEQKQIEELKEKAWIYVVKAVEDESASREEFYAIIDYLLLTQKKLIREEIENNVFFTSGSHPIEVVKQTIQNILDLPSLSLPLEAKEPTNEEN